MGGEGGRVVAGWLAGWAGCHVLLQAGPILPQENNAGASLISIGVWGIFCC